MDLHIFPIPNPLPPLSPPNPSGFSQCTRSEHLSHASNLGPASILDAFCTVFPATGPGCCFFSSATQWPGWSQLTSIPFCLRISFLCIQSMFVVVQSLSRVWFFVTPWIACFRLPCLSLYPGVCSNSRSQSWCWYPTISFSVIPFCSCLQFLPASGSLPTSHLFNQIGKALELQHQSSQGIFRVYIL